MKKWIAAWAVAGILGGLGVAWAAFPNVLTTLSGGQLLRVYYANSPGSVQGYTTLTTLAASGVLSAGVLGGPYPTATTGAGTQTFTNSPCTGLTTAEWIPVKITGQTGTWLIPACQ